MAATAGTSREALITGNLDLVENMAVSAKRRLPACVELDDLIGSGMIGLIHAADRFDPRRKIKFRTFAVRHIRGAMFDDIRALDNVPRLTRRRQRLLANLAGELGRQPTTGDVARHCDVSEALAERILVSGEPPETRSFSQMCRFDKPGELDQFEAIEAIVNDDVADPAGEVCRRDLIGAMLRGLSATQRLILLLYHAENLTMREIGRTIGISESRICQIHAELIACLRERLPEKGIDAAAAAA